MDKDNIDQNLNKIHLTQKGLEDLKEEFESLKNEKRPRLVERLSVARGQGDLSENQEYAQARQDLNLLDGRITELEEVIARAVIIDTRQNGSQEVHLGSRVTVDLSGQEIVFYLVGEWEANPSSQKISHKSPLGKKLLGRKPGDEIEVEAPVGKLLYKIVKIE